MTINLVAIALPQTRSSLYVSAFRKSPKQVLQEQWFNLKNATQLLERYNI